MKPKALTPLFTVLTLISPFSTKAQVVINELMASNNSTITDPDFGESADWVELYNTSDSEVDLSGYYITDDLNSPSKYKLPKGVSIKAGGYLLVWCDGKSDGLHTSFKLSADGESVGLYTPDQKLVDAVTMGAQLLDISYGREQNAIDKFAYFNTPTPGKSNDTEGFTGKANQPMILTRGGHFNGSVTVSITNDLGGDVHYTIDGSIPTDSSPIYKEPLTFSSTTILRARIIEEGKMPGNVMTESYFIDEAFEGHQLPVVSIATDDENFWSADKGIYAQDFKPDWEIPANIEMFINNGSDRSVFNENVGIKINGLLSWQLPQKMLGVYFKKKYGENKLEYKLFNDDKRNSFNDFALRVSGSDWSNTFMRDALIQQAARKGDMNVELMAFRPSVVYVNGKFLGIHNIREKVNEDYIKRHHDLNGAKFDLVEGGESPEVGSAESWISFFDKAKKSDLSNDANFKAFSDEFDVENFTDYIICESYSANTSLDHNTMVWKTVDGGKWRWILMDCDRGFYYLNSGIHDVIFQPFWPLNYMLTNNSYKSYFNQRMADQLFTTFNADEICRQIDQHEAEIAPLMDKQVARWKGTTSAYGNAIPSVEFWNYEVEKLRGFARDRVSFLLEELVKLGANKPAVLSLSSQPEDACSMTFNGHELFQTNWTGLYPKKMSITLTAEDKAGYTFQGWRQTTMTDLIARGSEWKYLDDGTDQGTAWRDADFDDSSWDSGKAPLGYKLSNINTSLPSGSKSVKPYTTYFRRHFNYDASKGARSLKIQLCRKDGVAVYINGKQVISTNLPIENLSYNSWAQTALDTLSSTYYTVYTISPDVLKDGENTIAVEVHLHTTASNELSFDLQLQSETLDADAPLLGTDNTIQIKLTGDMGVCAMYESTGENILPETIDNDMTLYKSKSPYLVPKNVVVGSNARLTIEPGVELLFSPEVNIIVNGAITAEGTPEDSIMFRLNPKYNNSKGWGAVCFINTGDKVSSVSYAEFREGSKGPQEYNCVAVVSGFKTILRLDHLRITDIHANPIACRYSDVRVTNSLLHMDITGDMINVKYGKGYVSDCEIYGNDKPDTDGIDFDGVEGGIIKRVVLHDFIGSNSDAIDIGEQAMGVTIDSVLIYDITDKGVSVGQRSTANVSNSTFIQTNLGLGIKDSCSANVDHCTFFAVRTPISCYEKVQFRAGGNANVTNCVFANSFIQDVQCDDKSKVIINHSLSDATELPYGSDNTLADPEFVAPNLYDLSSESKLLTDCGATYMPSRPNIQPVISEICYTPDASKGGTEYIMLTNVSTSDINLSGYSFAKGITYTFPEGTILPAGDSLYLVKDISAITTNSAPTLQWESGKLADEGETIELITPQGITVDQVSYLPTAPWPVIGKNGETAIMLKDILKANNIASNWQLRQTDGIKDIIANPESDGRAWDLLGRPVDINSARGVIILKGKKFLKK